MNQLCRTAVFALGAVALLSLVSCATNGVTAKPPTPRASSPIATTTPDSSGAASTASPKTPIAQNTGSLLSPQQKAQLAQLSMPIVLPSYLPGGFRLTKFSAEQEQGEVSGEYSSYSIFYQGANDTCLEFGANSDPAISLERLQKTSVETGLGKVKVYSGNVEGKPMIVGLFSLPNNNGYMLRTGAWMPPTIPGRRCNPVSMEEYIQVLKSLKRLK